MFDFLEMVLMGIVATLCMDFFAILFGELKIINQQIRPEAVGRWILYMLRGKFIHKDINKTPSMKIEKTMTFFPHYVIGIGLAGIYLFLEMQLPGLRHQLWAPIIFGIATVLLPWFWLYPSIGLGFMASKEQSKSPYIVTSLINHTNFGIGFLLWILVFR